MGLSLENKQGFHGEQDRHSAPTWDDWERAWRLLLPKIRGARGGAPRAYCMQCRRTVVGMGSIQSHKVVGHDIDVPGQARPINKREGVV